MTLSNSEIIEVFEFRMRARLDEEALEGVTAGPPMVAAAADMFARIVSQAFRVPGEEMYQHTWPLDWREAVKDRFLPQFARRWWPVRYETVSVKALYPKLRLPTAAVSWNITAQRVAVDGGVR